VSDSVAEEHGQSLGERGPAPGHGNERIQQRAFWLLLLVAEAAWVGGLVCLFTLFL
jgi:hypothetical protein